MLLVFGGFAHNPQGILAAVQWLALVGIERRLDLVFCSAKLRITAFADTKRRGLPYEFELPFVHGHSLAQEIG